MDNKRMQELEGLERWLAAQPVPRLDPQGLERIKAAVAAAAGAPRGAAESSPVSPMTLDRTKTRVRAAVHAARLRQQTVPAGLTRRLYPWVTAAAAVVLVRVALQPRDPVTPDLNLVFAQAAPAELVDLELDMLAVEWQAHAREIALFGAEDSRALRADMNEMSDPDYLMDFSAWFDQEGA